MFHYTNLSSLKKIIESKSLLATHLRYVNDTREFVHGCDLAISHLERWRSEMPRMDLERRTREAPIVERGIEKLKGMRSSPPEVFVSAFSRLRDDLSQWRGYTNDGKGVCVGFQRELMEDLAKKQHFVVADCGYQHPAGNLEEGMREFFSVFSPGGRGGEPFNDHELNILAARIKDFNFRAEMEVRLIHSADGSRPVEHVGFPRVRFDLSHGEGLCINQVIVCPSPDLETTKPNVEAYFRSRGMTVPVSESSIPYRSRPA